MRAATNHDRAAASGIHELAHHLAAAGEYHQRHYGEAELHGEDDLAEDQQLSVPRSPVKATTMMVGMMASERVIIRRSHGASLMFTKPSITTWPASVPVMEEFCPLARSAMAKSVLAPAAPTRG